MFPKVVQRHLLGEVE